MAKTTATAATAAPEVSERDTAIKAAIGALVILNDAHWVDGKPNLEVLKEALGPELTVEDVNRVTGGADRAAIARGRGEIVSIPEQAPVNESQDTREKTATAEQKLAAMEVKLGEAMERRQGVDKEIEGINAERDRLVRVVHAGGSVSHADAVKMIQKQSMEVAAQRKAAVVAASAAMIAAGVKPQHASILDQQLANRKRTPEQAALHAKFIQQEAANRNAARG
jgi:hypothetical protein